MDEIYLKAMELERVYQTAQSILRQTDIFVYRAMEKGVPVDPVMVEYRDAARQILTECTDPETVVWPQYPFVSEDPANE